MATKNENEQLTDDAFAHLDAAMPTVFATMEHLGNTDEARTFWLAQKSLEEAHRLLSAALGRKA